MPTFWENLIRYPRFFISSTLGLVFIITGPLFNLLNKPKSALLFAIIVFGILSGLLITLLLMLDII
ncbi:hypothetical chloroplast RF33 (chloroplast) [Guillardia theta]|uniref:Uncharacterized protein ycf33 n=2 Tax=Guillardia theta TaxID=55529 RepID=YCF33_GUITH|nr:hypothetical chloroplast RF33 [Guillardia theta]O78517.1 RecName: Full=Uncharacterized protein ycf33 [Guillardia theta]AAC35739.1 hypothetical chloroplast RF33 [Guillardia theta]